MSIIAEVADTFPWIFGVWIFVLGACVGSFLNVCIYRMPLEQSVVWPRSACPKCSCTIAFYDNVPILSWILLRGRCRACKARINFVYPFIEFLVGFLFLLCFLQLSLSVAAIGMIFVSLLVLGAAIDLKYFVLPDVCTIWLAVLGVLFSSLVPELQGVYFKEEPFLFRSIFAGFKSVIGLLIGSGVLLWIMVFAEKLLKKQAMGFGDVLLVGAVGAFCGWQGAIFSIFGGAVCALIILLPIMLVERIFGVKIGPRASQEMLESDNVDEESPLLGVGVAVPFGPWIAIGALLFFLFLRSQVEAYFKPFQELFL